MKVAKVNTLSKYEKKFIIFDLNFTGGMYGKAIGNRHDYFASKLISIYFGNSLSAYSCLDKKIGMEWHGKERTTGIIRHSRKGKTEYKPF